MAEQQDPGPTSTGRHRRDTDTLVRDVAGAIGTLNIVTGADRDELEIEISPVGLDAWRMRNIVHARRIGLRVMHTALFPNVPAGEYVVWHDESTPAGTIVVRGGQVAEYQLT